MMIRLGLERHDGSLATLDVGQWAHDDGLFMSAGRAHRVVPAVKHRCIDCGGTYDLDEADVDRDGNVGAEFICQTPSCNVVRLLKLEGWIERKFDVTDVAKPKQGVE